jgi:sortase A
MKIFIKKNLTTILLIMIFLVGLSLLLYPSFSNWWNTTYATHVIDEYTEYVASMDEDEYEKILADAKEYNEKLLTEENRYYPSDEMHESYLENLDVTGNGMMGSLYIPSIRVNLPVFHSSDDTVLSSGLGHIEGTSLPVGGKGTHCVISGHRGLPSAKLLTDLDKVQVGDYLILTVLDETLTYEVDNISIVLPDEINALEIDPDQDYLTLVTCTPYGVNTHRLLVRGHRVSNLNDFLDVSAEASVYDNKVIAPFFAIPIFLVMLLVEIIQTRKKKKEGKESL